MSDDELATITNAIKALEGEVLFIETQLFMEIAQRKALGYYTITLAERLGIDRKAMLSKIDEITKKVYSDEMDMIEKHRPAIAGKIDMRQSMPESQADDWYTIHYPEPSQD